MRHWLTLLVIALAISANADDRQTSFPDSKQLGKALDYFMGGKYHEALILMNKLDKAYNLNPRFKAYIGICHYHEWDYEQACRYLNDAMPQLEVYAPQERSVYYNIAAESHFMLEEYEKAIPLYEKRLLVCRDNEKGDAFYRLGFCYMFRQKWECAAEFFKSALLYYTKFMTPDSTSRIVQLERMIKGCEENIKTK